MKRFVFLFILAILLSAEVSAYCNSTQIDINSASAQELDKIISVGPATAQKIIASRPFSSVDDLLKVSGIGNVTLGKIKLQSLACVIDYQNIKTEEAEENNNENNGSATKNITKIQETVTGFIPQDSDNLSANVNQQIKTSVITSTQNAVKAVQKNINTQNGNEENKKYAIYGFISFCILLSVLFILKRKEKRKINNEFR
jgi:competence ComEA-like helix-hairpin-helix protein